MLRVIALTVTALALVGGAGCNETKRGEPPTDTLPAPAESKPGKRLPAPPPPAPRPPS